ncbi:MAG TPA: type II toxin-antitoxin system prevent-host-death family antitoxin [Thermoanaerobaculia bacterium]|nr:type II toxin-antitoxin system prevent-host-death family antitoxin [Thermoanaerobaculia bacterium]
MTTVSTRRLKDELSAYLRRAEKGEHVVVMRGSRPVAVLVPFGEAEGLDEAARLRQLSARGLVVLPEEGASRPRFSGRRVPSRGKSAAAMVLEDRR